MANVNEDRTSYDPYAPPPVTAKMPKADPVENLVTADELKLAPRFSIKGKHKALTEVNEVSVRESVHAHVSNTASSGVATQVVGYDEEVVVPEEANTVEELEDWVGDDVARAQVVLAAEQERDKPRKGLLKKLEQVIKESQEKDG